MQPNSSRDKLAAIMEGHVFPKLFAFKQNFPPALPIDIPAVIRAELEKLPPLKPASRIAVAAGSRGISNLAAIVGAVVQELQRRDAKPFIIPAMGSHGGATPEGQREILAGYGVTEASMGVPIRPSLEVQRVGTTEEGIEAFCSCEALGADAIVLVNRVKPHTDFVANIGSGIMKMTAIGLGKRAGAAACHAAAARFGLARVLKAVARQILAKTSIIGGVAILENQFHQTAKLEFLPKEQIETRESKLVEQARALMPRLPFDEIDLLVIDQIGKNISGSGMDPNITGRNVHGYTSSLFNPPAAKPYIKRIFVRDLTPETHGNAIGIGFADFATDRLVHAIDRKSTYINCLTSLTPLSAKIPIHFQSDRECLAHALATLALPDTKSAKVLRISDTLNLTFLEASEAFFSAAEQRTDLCVLAGAAPIEFDEHGNLPKIRTSA